MFARGSSLLLLRLIDRVLLSIIIGVLVLVLSNIIHIPLILEELVVNDLEN